MTPRDPAIAGTGRSIERPAPQCIDPARWCSCEADSDTSRLTLALAWVARRSPGAVRRRPRQRAAAGRSVSGLPPRSPGVGRLAPSPPPPSGPPRSVSSATPDELIPDLLELDEVGPDDLLVDVGCGDELDRHRRRGPAGLPGRGHRTRRSPRRCGPASELGRRDRRPESTSSTATARDSDLADATVAFLFHPPSTCWPRCSPSSAVRLGAGSGIVAHEQLALDPALAPDESVPLFGPASVTVDHLWRT